jgi:serine/threonine-protein phosphatase 5
LKKLRHFLHLFIPFVILSIEVEAQYDGPKFDDMKITKEFVEEMIEHFKKKKKIHEKYAYQVSNK